MQEIVDQLCEQYGVRRLSVVDAQSEAIVGIVAFDDDPDWDPETAVRSLELELARVWDRPVTLIREDRIRPIFVAVYDLQ